MMVTRPADEADDRLPAPEEPFLQASEEEMAEVEADTKQLLDTRGGKSLEVVLPPAMKKCRVQLPRMTFQQEGVRYYLTKKESVKQECI